MKLSETAKKLLLVIDHHTVRDWSNGKLERYWVPGVTSERGVIGTRRDQDVLIGGAGDANALRSLERKGLIERPAGSAGAYDYAITEDGRMAVEAILAEIRERPDSDKYNL